MIIVRVSSPIYGIASRAYRNVFDSWLTPRLPGGAPQIAFATIGIARGSRRDLQMYGHFGSGGWTVPAEAIAPGAICYCAGVGEDVSFDLALIEKHACEVFSIRPDAPLDRVRRERGGRRPALPLPPIRHLVRRSHDDLPPA